MSSDYKTGEFANKWVNYGSTDDYYNITLILVRKTYMTTIMILPCQRSNVHWSCTKDITILQIILIYRLVVRSIIVIHIQILLMAAIFLTG